MSKSVVVKKNMRVTPKQLALFESLVDVRFSNSIEIYDLMPKYLQEKVTTFQETDLPPEKHVIERRFQTHVVDETGRRLAREGYVKIKPAVIMRKKEGELKRLFAYPSYFEQLVEDAIRKLAVEQGAFLNDGQVGCRFSISQVRKLLSETGHQCKHADVVEAINILNGSQLEYGLVDPDGKGRASGRSTYFPTIYIRTRDEGIEDGEFDSVVQFHELVNASIREKTFRNYDFITCMKYRLPLSNYMHKRISMRFRQAATGSPYSFHLKKMIEDGGFNVGATIAKNVEAMKKSLQELIEAKVIEKFEYALIADPNDKRRSIDASFHVYVTAEFERQVITINRHSKYLVGDDDAQQ